MRGTELFTIITQNQRMREVLKLAHTVAASDSSTLLEGETGVGKDKENK